MNRDMRTYKHACMKGGGIVCSSETESSREKKGRRRRICKNKKKGAEEEERERKSKEKERNCCNIYFYRRRVVETYILDEEQRILFNFSKPLSEDLCFEHIWYFCVEDWIICIDRHIDNDSLHIRQFNLEGVGERVGEGEEKGTRGRTQKPFLKSGRVRHQLYQQIVQDMVEEGSTSERGRKKNRKYFFLPTKEGAESLQHKRR